jgi:hypothetical protein
VAGLTQVLAFADAVGSQSGLCKALCSQLQQLKVVVQVPEQVLELPLAGYTYWFGVRTNKLVQFNLHNSTSISEPPASVEQRLEMQQQVAKQLAALLQLAHVLRLQPLLDVLHGFITCNARPGHPYLLSGVMSLVFTDMVLQTALGSSSTLSKEAYVSSVLSEPCSLSPGEIGHSSLLKPVGPRTYDTFSDLLVFDAVLLRDFAGAKAGDTVKVTLDLFGKSITRGRGLIKLQLPSAGSSFVTRPVQLLLGYTFSEAAALEEFLKDNPFE